MRHCLSSLASRWEDIGIELDINPDSLDTIEANHDDVRKSLTDMIKLWLRQTTPPPTWQALAAAVQDIDPQKAQEITLRYCS